MISLIYRIIDSVVVRGYEKVLGDRRNIDRSTNKKTITGYSILYF